MRLEVIINLHLSQLFSVTSNTSLDTASSRPLFQTADDASRRRLEQSLAEKCYRPKRHAISGDAMSIAIPSGGGVNDRFAGEFSRHSAALIFARRRLRNLRWLRSWPITPKLYWPRHRPGARISAFGDARSTSTAGNIAVDGIEIVSQKRT